MEPIEKVVNEYFDAICALNLDGWLATFAADGVSHEPGNPPLEGHGMLAAFFNGVAAGFETIEMRPKEIYAVGNEAAVKWAANGKGKNGRDVAFEGIDVFTLNDAGKIQTLRAYWNPAAMMAQLMA